MTLSFKILGFEIASLDLDLPESEPVPETVSVLDKAAKAISNGFFKRMIR